MLLIAHRMTDLSFAKLMEIYREGNCSAGYERYSHETPDTQLRLAECDFYNYLNSVFFRQEHSFYAVWVESGEYMAALRLEPYADGMLLCALETAPNERRKGYASLLMLAVREYLKEYNISKVYSHVSKKNLVSLSVHQKIGFSVCKEFARYSDGSVSNNSYTLALTL